MTTTATFIELYMPQILIAHTITYTALFHNNVKILERCKEN